VLVITNLDRLSTIDQWKTCYQYQYLEHPSDLQNFFDFDGHQIREIKIPVDPTDLVHQAELASLLFRVKPIYEFHEKDLNSYVEFISRTLNLPITITSFGPAPQDKKTHPAILAKKSAALQL
jgi:adenylosuccinate synthase